MSLKISLKDFALTGDFGPVKIGMTKGEVKVLLGKPDHDEDFGSGFSGMIYSRYEFFFDDQADKLYAIQNDHLEASCANHDEMILFKNNCFEVETWFVEVGKLLTFRDVKGQLSSQGIAFIEKEQYKRPHLYFDSGVYLDFGPDEGGSYFEGDQWHKIQPKEYDSIEDWPLIGIRYFPDEW